MISLPESTAVGTILPKEEFYRRLKPAPGLQEKFVSQLRRIKVENLLTAHSLRLAGGPEAGEIIVLGLELKQKEYDGRMLELIARHNTHRLLFRVQYEREEQWALFWERLYYSAWQDAACATLETKGFTLDEIWEGYVRQIALPPEAGRLAEAGLAYHLRRQEHVLRLQKNIEKLEKAARAEKQPKKRFALAMQVRQLKNDLDTL